LKEKIGGRLLFDLEMQHITTEAKPACFGFTGKEKVADALRGHQTSYLLVTNHR
jgi:hypothetical protein